MPRSYIDAPRRGFSGPGALTRALLTLPRDTFDKLIVLEDHPGYLEYLKVTEQPAHIRSSFRLTTFRPNTFSTLRSHWKKSMIGSGCSLTVGSTGTRIPCWASKGGWTMSQKSHGTMEVRVTTPRFTAHVANILRHLCTVHPTLHFISHVPLSVFGEQLMNQFLRCIPDKAWLFKYGRVPLNLITGERVWQVSPSYAPPFFSDVSFVICFFRLVLWFLILGIGGLGLTTPVIG